MTPGISGDGCTVDGLPAYARPSQHQELPMYIYNSTLSGPAIGGFAIGTNGSLTPAFASGAQYLYLDGMEIAID